MKTKFTLSETRQEGIAQLAQSFIASIHNALKLKSSINVLLSGGNTPLELYAHIMNTHLNVPWHKVTFIMVDERYVPLDSDRSNSGQCLRAFIDNISPRCFIFPDTALAPQACVNKFSDDLVRQQIEDIDVALLGTAPDGHVASIFPKARITYQQNDVLFVEHSMVEEHRVSLSLSAINTSNIIFVMAFGDDKKAIVEQKIAEVMTDLPIFKLKASKTEHWFYHA